ncbi:single-stranded DNA-binding protein [Candidatus Gottesmanbacteria bacterium]|nr:single-stranded DNA-binding protein [Candidatus Gottesmanbacteria bacterium]MBI5452634.1 single-stranded DNA-binding protein [Candidatus Gottesmanbacteria bacterium]
MANRSLNKVTLIGNLTRDPELRYTPAGTAVCTFGLATNRSWTTQSGETKEATEFHRIVAWNKLGELCAQLLAKGRKVYVEGRLATHSWTGQDGAQHTTTEIVIEDMIILDSKRVVREGEVTPVEPAVVAEEVSPSAVVSNPPAASDDTKKAKKSEKKDAAKSDAEKKETAEVPKESPVDENITPDDIPF